MRRHGPLVLVGLLLVILFAVAFIVRPASDDGPGGIAVLRRFLSERGVEVSAADRPGVGTFFLRYDLRTGEQAEPVLDWVRGGGLLVVADPASRLLPAVGIHRALEPVAGFLPEQRIDTDCVTPEVVGVERIVASALDATFRPTADTVGCFRRGAGTFMVRRAYGSGVVVALGGATPLTNEYLDEEDDILLAWNILGAPADKVVFGTPRPAGASTPEGLWALLPAAARVIIVQLVLAAGLFAAARGRRLGAPVEERMPSTFPATDLVRATAELYRRARAAGHAVALLRDRFRARTGRRLGVGPRPDDAALADAVRDAIGGGIEDLQRVGATGAEDERTLVATARGLERLERRIEGGESWEERETSARR